MLALTPINGKPALAPIEAAPAEADAEERTSDQAAALRSRVSQAVEKATSWAYAKLRQSHPELVKRVEDHQQAERRQVMERQQKEREAKRALQKGQDRGHSR